MSSFEMVLILLRTVSHLRIGKLLHGGAEDWCTDSNITKHNRYWKFIFHNEFYGCEDQVIVTFDIGYLMPEQFSRAKTGLIIVTTKG